MTTATFGRRNIVQRAPASTAPRVPQPAPNLGDVDSHTATADDPSKTRNVGIGAVVLIVVGVLMAVAFGPELYRDWTLQGTFRPAFDVKVERASCRRYAFVITYCSVQLSWKESTGRVTASSSFLVGLKGMGGIPIIPMRSSSDPSVVTSSVAVEHIANRAGTLILAPGLVLLVGFLMLMGVRNGRT